MDSGKQSSIFRIFGLPIAKFLGGCLIMVCGPLWIRHSRRVPKGRGLLILANHLADVDPILVQVACRRPVYFMAKSELFEMPILRTVIRWFRAFPVKRGEPDRSSIKHAVELLKSGEAVCVFPEGQLSESGEMQPLLGGVELIARMAKVDVICVGLKNTNRMMPYGTIIPRPGFAVISASWGQVQPFAEISDRFLSWADAELRALIA